VASNIDIDKLLVYHQVKYNMLKTEHGKTGNAFKAEL
jgi:hypothetical protein